MTGPYTDASPVSPGLDVLLPSGATITSTHQATLDLPSLPLAARKCHLFPDLTSGSLISVGQLCNYGCTAQFTATTVTVTHEGATVLHGSRAPPSGLWLVQPPEAARALSSQPPAMLLSATQHSTVAERVAFYHAAMFSPPLSTWCAAIDAGYLTTWPDLTSAQIRRHPPFSIPMIQGHLDQQRANLRSTQRPVPNDDCETDPIPPNNVADAANPMQPTIMREPLPVRTHNLFVDCQLITGQIATDLPGRFLVPSSRGNSYMLVVYDYDSNYIHAEPLRSRSGPDILAGYKRSIDLLKSRGLTPRLQRLDNEASQALQQFLQDEGIDYQLAPPHVHRRNSAERAIRTFKNHFIAGLCGTDPDFPLHLWDRLLPQALVTLNLLRASRINPRLSAHAQLHGAFDFNRTPLAPAGTRVMIHEKSSVRGTWAPHAVDGWYLGPAEHHYRCYRVYVKETSAERIADTVVWFPQHVRLPVMSSSDAATSAAQALTQALLNPTPASPLSAISDYQRDALTRLADIFADVAEEQTPATRTPEIPTQMPPPPPGFNALPPLSEAVPPPRVSLGTPAVIPPPLPRVATTSMVPVATTCPALIPISTPAAPSPPAAGAVPAVTSTYTVITGNVGRRRRQAAARARARATPIPVPAIVLPHNTRNRATRRGVLPRANATSQLVNAADAHFVALCAAFADNTDESLPAAHDETTASSLRPPDSPSHSAHAVLDPISGAALSYRQLREGQDGPEWLQSAANEIGRLAQGVLPHMPHGTDTIHFIRHDAIPPGRKATYLRIVAELRPLKAETKRVRFTAGGDKIDYPGNVSTPTADLTTVKVLLNSVLSTPNARFATGDLANFYLNNPMERYEYMRIPVRDIPPSIMIQYNLLPLVHKDHVLVEIRKGMYGLPQAGIIANTRLVKHLATHGYIQVAHTAGLFTHVTRPVTFCLTVDDFGIKYVDKANADHLFQALRELYTITVDWTGTKYCGLTLAWDYIARTCDVSMPGYIAKALLRFQHIAPARPQHSPHAWQAPVYGAATQFTPPTDDSALLNAAGITRVQEIIGVLLYYARAVDNTLLVALGTLASAPKSEDTVTALVQLLNYCATHSDAVIRFHASDMVLHVHSDASYLSEAQARSRSGGYFFLSSRPTDPNKAPLPSDPPPPPNGPIHVPSSIMRVVLSSATEAEMGALFYNAKDAAWLRTTLTDLGHPQPPTPIQTDNACAAGIINDTVKQRRSKAIDMRFYWVRDRVRQNQFVVHWRRGTDNLADYFTKHHSPSHHRLLRSQYLYTGPPPDPATAAFAAKLALHPRTDVPLAPVPLPILDEGVLRNYPCTSGFPSLLTQNVITTAASSINVSIAEPLINS